MNKNFLQKLIILSFVMVAFSCENSTEIQRDKLIGEWSWKKTEGGFFGQTIEPLEGVSIVICFESTGIYKIFRNDTLKLIANYKIGKGFENYDKISYSNIKTIDYKYHQEYDYVTISDKTLILWDGSDDGYFSSYLKK